MHPRNSFISACRQVFSPMNGYDSCGSDMGAPTQQQEEVDSLGIRWTRDTKILYYVAIFATAILIGLFFAMILN